MKLSSLRSVVRFRRASLVAGLLALITSGHAQTTYTWTAPLTGAVNWSAGTWTNGVPVSNSTATLTFSQAMTAASNLANDLGTFNLTTLNDTHTGAFALTISGNQLNFNGTSNAINFNSSNADTISAAINFTNGLTVTVSPFTGYTLSGTITGSGGLVKNGSNGSLTISGGNSYTGGTTLNGNSLILGSNTAAGTGTILLNAGTLSSTATARSIINALQIGGNVAIGNGNQTFAVSGGVDLLNGTRTLSNAGTSAALVTLSGVVSNGTLVKDSVGSMLLSNSANTYAGGTTINNGTLQFADDGSRGTGGILINNGGALAVNSSTGRTTVAGWLSSGLIDTASTGTIALTGNSSANVDFSANGGYNLLLGAYANSTFTGTLTPNGTTYRLGGGGATLTLSGTNALTGTNTLQVGPALRLGAVGTPTGAIPNAQTSAGGTVALSASNDISGATTVNSGTLSLSGSTGSLASSDATVSSNGTLNFAPSAAGTVTRAKSATLNGGALTVTGVAFGTTDAITNALTLNSGASTITITPNAAGVSTLAAANLARTSGQGWALVNGVSLGKDTASTTNVGRIILGSDPTLVGTTAALSTGINSSAKDTMIVPWLVGAVTSATGGVGTASAAANTFLTYNASTGLRPLNLTDEFTNNAITAGTNTYITANTTGASTASINSLVIQAANASPPALSLNNGVTLTVASGALLFTPTTTTTANTATIQATSGTATLDFGSTEGVITVQNATGVGGSNTATISTVVTGTGGLSKFGAGILALSNAASTYTGVTTINNGILAATTMTNGGSNSSIGASSNAASNLILNGGVLRYAGTVGTTVSTDRLVSVGLLGGGIQSSGTAAINFTNTGTIGFNGESGARTFVLAGSTASLVNTFNPIIADNGGPTTLIRTVNGTAQNSVWILGGLNTYTGATQINGDTNNQGGTLSVSILANGGIASGIGASTNAASNLLINRGTLQYTGATVSTDRLFTIGTSGGTLDASGTGTLTFANTGALAFTAPSVRTMTLTGTNTGNNTLALLIADSGANTAAHATSLTKTGAGTWMLTNANTYTGTTNIGASATANPGNIAGGVLSVSSIADGGTTSNIGASTNAAGNLVFNSGTLKYTGASASTDRLFTIGSVTSGASATLDASGTGAINFTNTGSLAYGNTNQVRTLTLRGTNTGANTLSALIANNGTGMVSVAKSDAGTWVLAGANTYTGSTTVNAGTLALGANNAFSSGSAITLSGGTLNLQTFSTSAASLSFNAGSSLMFGLGTPGNVTALLALTTNFTKSGSGVFTLDFSGSGQTGTYNLVSFTGTTFASQSDFTIANLGSGLSGALTLNGTSLSLAITAVPEPSTYAALFGALALVVTVRRRRASLRSR